MNNETQIILQALYDRQMTCYEGIVGDNSGIIFSSSPLKHMLLVCWYSIEVPC